MMPLMSQEGDTDGLKMGAIMLRASPSKISEHNLKSYKHVKLIKERVLSYINRVFLDCAIYKS